MIPTGIPLKSNPLTATHTCTRTLDTLTQTWHSARPDSYTSLRLGTADRRGPPSPGVRRKHLDYYFWFFFLYSRRTVQGHMRVINGASNLLQEKLKSPDSKSNTLIYSYQLFPAHFVMLLWCYSNKKNLDMEMEFYLNLLEWFSTSVRWRANRKLFGKVWLTHNWVNLRHVKLSKQTSRGFEMLPMQNSVSGCFPSVSTTLIGSQLPRRTATDDLAHTCTPAKVDFKAI